MSEEIKQKISGEEKIETKLAKIELGKDYCANIIVQLESDKNNDKIEFNFKVHIPTLKEELKIPIRQEEIFGKNSSNVFTNSVIRMIATLDIAIDEIIINGDKFNNSFWELIQGIRQVSKFYKQVIDPVYGKFIEFQNSVEIDFEDLKKNLTSLGKK